MTTKDCFEIFTLHHLSTLYKRYFFIGRPIALYRLQRRQHQRPPIGNTGQKYRPVDMRCQCRFGALLEIKTKCKISD